MVKFQTGNLFEAPSGSYLAHACNCMGVWGRGVAQQFKEKFPKSFLEYNLKCQEGANPGDILICNEENGYKVVCLFTSKDYGNRVDSIEDIIEATKKSLSKLPVDAPIHMPLINAGLFRVPWEKTGALLQEHDDLDITVWSLI